MTSTFRRRVVLDYHRLTRYPQRYEHAPLFKEEDLLKNKIFHIWQTIPLPETSSEGHQVTALPAVIWNTYTDSYWNNFTIVPSRSSPTLLFRSSNPKAENVIECARASIYGQKKKYSSTTRMTRTRTTMKSRKKAERLFRPFSQAWWACFIVFVNIFLESTSVLDVHKELTLNIFVGSSRIFELVSSFLIAAFAVPHKARVLEHQLHFDIIL